MTTRTWKRLPLLDNGQQCPPLLFSYEIASKGYELYLTDLAHIWGESLNRRSILKRASEDETSIDPSQDDDQLSVLLQKIGVALDGHKGSSISLKGCKKGSNIELITITKLPSPLEPLTWSIQLSRLPQSALTQNLLLPALQGGTEQENRIHLLIEILKEKDRLLGRLFDKIESSNVDLSTVLPGMTGVRAGRKGSLFSQASKLVRGVAPFDEEAWNVEYSGQTSHHNIAPAIMQQLSSGEGAFDTQRAGQISDDWWNNITLLKGGYSPNRQVPQKAAMSPQDMGVTEDEHEDEDEFQRQATPPRLKSTPLGDESDDVEMEPSNKKDNREMKRPGSPKAKSKSKTIGSIGKSKKKKEIMDDSTASSVSDKPPNKAKAAGLGSIGGKKKREHVAPPPRRESPDDTASSVGEPDELSADVDACMTTLEDEGDIDTSLKRQKASQQSTASNDGGLHSQPKSKQGEKSGKPRDRGMLGQIGGKKRKESPEVAETESSPTTMPARGRNQNQASEELVEEDEANNGKHSSSNKMREQGGEDGDNKQSTAPKPTKRVGKLGMIGGGRKAAHKQDTEEQESPAGTASAAADNDAGDGDDDVAGGSDSVSRASQARGPKRSASPPSSRPATKVKKEVREETPEERANRKREEIRRQLDAKNKGTGAPAKKKRRF
ncbi:hypothetical protein FQN57_002138 [Myotisia sp. PD_48]|nr:hypothetical protein FQN57_002138 [Myotisia sp. PD_48]